MPSSDWQALGAKREPHSDARMTVSLLGWKLKMTGAEYLTLEKMLLKAAIGVAVLVLLAVVLFVLYLRRDILGLQVAFDVLAVVLRIIGIILLCFFSLVIAGVIGTAFYFKLNGIGCVDCPRCHTQQPRFRMPASVDEIKRGGWTCRVCGCEMDRSGQEVIYE